MVFSLFVYGLGSAGLDIFVSPWNGNGRTAPEVGRNLSLAFEAGFVLRPVVETPRASVYHHDGLFEYGTFYCVESFWV